MREQQCCTCVWQSSRGRPVVWGGHLADTCESPGTDGNDVDTLDVLDELVECVQGRLLQGMCVQTCSSQHCFALLAFCHL